MLLSEKQSTGYPDQISFRDSLNRAWAVQGASNNTEDLTIASLLSSIEEWLFLRADHWRKESAKLVCLATGESISRELYTIQKGFTSPIKSSIRAAWLWEKYGLCQCSEGNRDRPLSDPKKGRARSFDVATSSLLFSLEVCGAYGCVA